MAKLKLKRVIEEMVANGGNMEKAVRESGYSKSYARSGKITKTKTWKAFLEKYFSEDLILKKHKELLQAQKSLRNDKGEVIGYENDYKIQLKALDIAYKLLGKYATVKYEVTNPYDSYTIAEIDFEIARLESNLNLNKKITQ